MEENSKQNTVLVIVAACVLAQAVLYGVTAFADSRNWMAVSLEQITWGKFGLYFLVNALALLLPPVVFLLITRTRPNEAGVTAHNRGLVLALVLAFGGLVVLDGNWSAGGVYYWLHILINIALGEELMYRGFVYSRLKRVSPWLALLVSGFFWGAGHAIYAGVVAGRSVPQILLTMVVGGAEVPVNAFGGILAGIGFAALYEWSGTLFVPILLHAILDFSGHSPAGQWLGFAVTIGAVVFLGVKRTRVERKPLAFWKPE